MTRFWPKGQSPAFFLIESYSWWTSTILLVGIIDWLKFYGKDLTEIRGNQKGLVEAGKAEMSLITTNATEPEFLCSVSESFHEFQSHWKRECWAFVVVVVSVVSVSVWLHRFSNGCAKKFLRWIFTLFADRSQEKRKKSIHCFLYLSLLRSFNLSFKADCYFAVTSFNLKPE